jgi:hypothetical protein
MQFTAGQLSGAAVYGIGSCSGTCSFHGSATAWPASARGIFTLLPSATCRIRRVLFALPASAALLVGLRHLRDLYHESELYQ